MEKWMSVLKLLFAQIIYRILGILLALTVGEGAFFFILMSRYQSGKLMKNYYENLTGGPLWVVLDRTHLGVFFIIAYLLLAYWGINLSTKKSKAEHTYDKLRISTKTLCALVFTASLIGISMLYFAQIVLVYGLERVGIWMLGNRATEFSLYLSVHNVRFLHTLLPFGEVGLLARNLVFLLLAAVIATMAFLSDKTGNSGFVTNFLNLFLVGLIVLSEGIRNVWIWQISIAVVVIGLFCAAKSRILHDNLSDAGATNVEAIAQQGGENHVER